nr:hypothetical protein [Tumebacillus sp. BK434]
MSTAMHSVIALGDDHKPLTRVIIWADNRSVRRIRNEFGGHAVVKND